jgi:hypothetical protein
MPHTPTTIGTKVRTLHPEQSYDAVLCVSPHHVTIAKLALRSLLHFSTARKIFVITAEKHFPQFALYKKSSATIILLDEDEVVENVSLSKVCSYLTQRIGNPDRSGWYFQQFLKMAICQRNDIAEHYLLWDSDTIALQPLSFFAKGNRILVTSKTENHKPYFDLIEKLLNIRKQVDYSFISEHFMIRKNEMLNLITTIQLTDNKNQPWPYTILDAISNDDISGSGFSEYETYGNFISQQKPNYFVCTTKKSIRKGSKLFGHTPSTKDIFYLIKEKNTFASFEIWGRQKNRKIFMNKIKSYISYASISILSAVLKKQDKRIIAAKKICS